MNKTVNINLAGTFFHIDEDAYAKLRRYLDAIHRSFSDLTGQDEIIKDIEARIAELFSERTRNSSQVITIREVDEVIAIMGQPEDYIVDEEIFEEAPRYEYRERRNQSHSRQLFRDVDNKVVAGVSSGLSHYLNIDVIWIRLIWIALVFLGWGAPILIYILLWIIVPPATTTAEKIKMNRKPVNISNIEKKFNEEFNKASEKIKDVDYDKYKETVKKGASSFFEVLARIVKVIFKVFGKLFGVILIIVSISSLISLFIGLFSAGTLGVGINNFVIFDYTSVILAGNMPLWIPLILTFFAIGIPFFVLFILGLKLLISNLKSIGTAAKIILFITWISSVIGLGIIAIKQEAETGYDGEYITEKTLPIKQNDTLQIKMATYNKFDHSTHKKRRNNRNNNFELRLNENNEKIIFSNDIRLIVRSTKDTTATIVIEKSAEGNSFQNAQNRAINIDYEYKFNNNTLSLNDYFTTDYKNKYLDQKVEVFLYLPIGTILFADDNTYHYHRNTSRYEDILNNGDEEKYLQILKNKTICLDCPKSENNEPNSTENESWEIEVNNSFNNNLKINKKDSNHIILNEDGVDIKLTDEEDNIKIQIGN